MIGNSDVEDFYPLSPTQHGILFHTLYTPNTRVYFQQLTYTVRGSLDAPLFERTWQKLLDRHSVLRSSFLWEDLKEPVQLVHRGVRVPLESLDWRDLPAKEQQQCLQEFLKSDRERGFDLSQAPMVRLALIRLADEGYALVWSFHHILMDGWSASLIRREFFEVYGALSRGEDSPSKPPRPYRDYVSWLRRQDLSKARDFWRAQLKDFTGPTPLGVDRGSKYLPDKEEGYDDIQTKLSLDETARLRSFARRHQLTLNTIVLGAWALLLSQYSDQHDIAFGVVVSGRTPLLADVESMIGLFINTLPMRVQIQPRYFVLSWLKDLQARSLEMQQYEYTPLVKIQGWSDVPGDQPLFNSIFAFENFPAHGSTSSGDLSIEAIEVRSFERTSYPLTLMTGAGPELALRILYDCRRIDTAAVIRMTNHLRTSLEELVMYPHQRMSDLSVFTEKETRELIDDFNADVEVSY